MNVEIAELAEADLEAIYLRIREDSRTRASEWRLGFLKAAQTLDQFPERCPLAPELHIRHGGETATQARANQRGHVCANLSPNLWPWGSRTAVIGSTKIAAMFAMG